MEPVYRRHSTSTVRRSQLAGNTNTTTYKQGLLKRTLLCFLLFALCLFIKFAPEENAKPAQNAIKLMLKTETDFRNMPTELREWVQSLLPGEEVKDLKEGDVLIDPVKPVDAPITSPFGLRTHPTSGTESFHYGVDLGAPEGEKIKSIADGEVVEAGENPDYGNYLAIRHSESIYSLYAHCSQVLPSAGDRVTAGQVIATVGATGNATGPHLHLEIRNGETWLNPSDFLDFEEAKND